MHCEIWWWVIRPRQLLILLDGLNGLSEMLAGVDWGLEERVISEIMAVDWSMERHVLMDLLLVGDSSSLLLSWCDDSIAKLSRRTGSWFWCLDLIVDATHLVLGFKDDGANASILCSSNDESSVAADSTSGSDCTMVEINLPSLTDGTRLRSTWKFSFWAPIIA